MGLIQSAEALRALLEFTQSRQTDPFGARRLPSAQAALLSASEVPMAPLWVWIFFNEVPARETFIGDGLVLAAILWNVGVELRGSARAAAV